MTKRPLSITVIAALFLFAGTIGLIYHARELMGVFNYQVVWVLLVRLLAVVGAVFLFRGHNWARWLLVAWMAFHVILSALHSVSQVVVHGLLMALITYFLFRRSTFEYFFGPNSPSTVQGFDPAKK